MLLWCQVNCPKISAWRWIKYCLISIQHPCQGMGKESNARKVWRKEMGNKGRNNCPANGPERGQAAKLSLDVAESLLYLQLVEWNVISAAVWTQVGLISTAPKWEGALCFWVALGLTLPKAKLRHVPAYSVLTMPHFLCSSVEQGRKNGIPGLSLWWGWFLDKWAVSEVCLKCKDTQECWCKSEV